MRRPIGLKAGEKNPHSLDNQLTDGSEVVSITLLARFTPQEDPGTYFF
jgi:hypothetical protein